MKIENKTVQRVCQEFTGALAQFVSIVGAGANRNPISLIQDDALEALPSYAPAESPQSEVSTEILALSFPKTISIAQAEEFAQSLGFVLEGTETRVSSTTVSIVASEVAEDVQTLLQSEEVVLGEYKKMGLPMTIRQGEAQQVVQFIVRLEPKTMTQDDTVKLLLQQYESGWLNEFDASYRAQEAIETIKAWTNKPEITDFFAGVVGAITSTNRRGEEVIEGPSTANTIASPIGFEELLQSGVTALILALRVGTKEQALASVDSMFEYRQRLIEAQAALITPTPASEQLMEMLQQGDAEPGPNTEAEPGSAPDVPELLQTLMQAVSELTSAQAEMKALMEDRKTLQQSEAEEPKTEEGTAEAELAASEGVAIQDTASPAVAEAPPAMLQQSEQTALTQEQRRAIINRVVR